MKRSLILKIVGGIVIALVIGFLLGNVGLHVYAVDEPITASPSDCQGTTRFAVIGDFGEAGQTEADVAALVDSWGVEFIVTVGDNNYPDGEASTIDQNIGQYYQAYIHPYHGDYGPGASENRFWPALGNHDWDTGTVQPYLDYFTLPGNGRYYDFEKGPIHFFVLDSDPREPDGRSRDSVQADWLQDRMDDDDAPWRLVVLHHPPYSSSLLRGENEEMQWPFARWGASALLAGHEHLYERAYVDGIPQFVVGLGGKWKGINPVHRFDLWPIPGSRVRYNQDYGALLVTADDVCINFSFYNRGGELIDSYTMTKEEGS
jgi:hypothetical protein